MFERIFPFDYQTQENYNNKLLVQRNLSSCLQYAIVAGVKEGL